MPQSPDTPYPQRIHRSSPTQPGRFMVITLLLLALFPHLLGAATISAKAVSVTLTAADFGLAADQPHASWSGNSTLDGGDVSGTDISLTEGTTTITKTNLLFWTYTDSVSTRNITANYTLTNPTLVITGIPSATSRVTISSVSTSSITYKSSTKLYSGYANMTLDLSNATRSGSYKTTGTTITINITII